MVISSSPARSNDQLLVVATRSTTSSGLTRDCSEKSVRDMPRLHPCRSEVGCAHRPHAHHAAWTRSPLVEPIERSGANHLRVEYNPLIPAAKAQLDRRT